MYNKIVDSLFKKTGNRKSSEQINKRLQQLYFNGYWNKFDFSVWCFDSLDDPLESKSQSLQNFKSRIQEQGRETYCDKMFFLQNESGKLNYLAILPLTSERDSVKFECQDDCCKRRVS